MIPLSVPSLKGNELKYVTECIETEWVSSAGPFVTRFERDVARYLEIPSAVACINRSEEHTSELQSQSNLVCRLLLEKTQISTTTPDSSRIRLCETAGSCFLSVA